MARVPDLRTLRAAWWALRSSRRALRRLDRLGLDAAVTLPSVPAVPDDAGRGVYAILNRRADTCLVRSMVLQAWEAAHGRERDLIVGVTPPARGFQAHAWLEGDPPCAGQHFAELLRRPPR